MLVSIVGFVLIQAAAIGIGYKRGKIDGIQRSGQDLHELSNIKFRKHMADLRKKSPHLFTQRR